MRQGRVSANKLCCFVPSEIDAFRREINELKLKRKQLASASNLHGSTIYKILRGKWMAEDTISNFRRGLASFRVTLQILTAEDLLK